MTGHDDLLARAEAHRLGWYTSADLKALIADLATALRAATEDDPSRDLTPLVERLDDIAQDESLPSWVQIAAHDAAGAIRSNANARADRDKAWAEIEALRSVVRHALEDGYEPFSDEAEVIRRAADVPAADAATQDEP